MHFAETEDLESYLEMFIAPLKVHQISLHTFYKNNWGLLIQSISISDCCKQSLNRLFHSPTQDQTFLSLSLKIYPSIHLSNFHLDHFMQLIIIFIIHFHYKTVQPKVFKLLFSTFLHCSHLFFFFFFYFFLYTYYYLKCINV